MPNRKDLRPCDYYTSHPKGSETKPKKGLFHAWGTETIETNDTVSNYSVGIVENIETGVIVTPMPSWITFTDLQEQSDIHDMSSAD